MAAIRAGVAYVDILPRFSKFAAGLQVGMNRVAKQMDVIGSRLTKTLALPLAAIGVASVHLAVEFEESMDKIIGLVGIGADEVHKMGEEVLKLAPTVGKGPKELAEALFFITGSGIKGAAAMDVLRESARAAAAGLGETKVIADAVTSAVNAYGIKNLSAAEATDILVAAVREGKGEAADFAQVIGRVVPLASELGVSFGDVGGAIAAMTRQGLDASEAVTALRGFLATLIKPTAKGVKVMKELGISVTEASAGAAVLEKALASSGLTMERLREVAGTQGLFAAMQLLKTSLGGNVEALGAIIPNVRALTGFLNITGQNAEANAVVFDKVRNAVGSTDHAFAAAAKTAKFKMRAALAGLQAVGVKLGQILLPTLKDVADGFLRLVQRFDKLSPGVKKFAIQLTIALAVLGPLIKLSSRFVKTISSLVGLGAGIVQFFGAIIMGARGAATATGHLTLAQKIGIVVGKAFRAVFLTTFGLIAVAIVALVVLVYVFRKQVFGALKAIGRFFVRIWKSVFSFVMGVWDGMVDAWRDFVNGLRKIWEGIKKWIVRPIVAAVKAVGSAFTTGFKAVAGVFSKIFGVLADIVGGFIKAVKIGFRIWSIILIIASAPVIAFVTIVTRVLQALIGFLTKVVVAGFKKFVEFVGDVFGAIVDVIGDVFAPIVRVVAKVFEAVWDVVKTVVGFIVDVVRAGVRLMTRVIKFYIDTYKAIFGTAFNAVKRVVLTVWNAIRDATRVVWRVITSVLSTAWSTIQNVIQTAVGIIKTAWNGLKNAANTMRDVVVAAVRFLVDKFLAAVEWIIRGAAKAFGWLPVVGDDLRKAAKDFERFRDRVNAALNGIRDRVVTVRAEFAMSPYGSQATRNELATNQSGGPVSAGEWSWVGERGKELVRFGRAGRVYSHEDSMAMVGADLQPASGDTFNIVNNYPKPERVSEHLPRVLRREQYLRGRRN